MILPAVIEEGNAAVDRFLHHADGGTFIFGIAQMVTAEAKRGDMDIVTAEAADRNC